MQSSLQKGTYGDEVTKLQEILAGDREIYPEGLVTGFFGPLTLRAVKKFQEKYSGDILAPLNLSAATGFVGSSTLKKLNELMGF
jgi:peptidoglycan hydrolase-like protein with peptidoglycan-binding domain